MEEVAPNEGDAAPLTSQAQTETQELPAATETPSASLDEVPPTSSAVGSVAAEVAAVAEPSDPSGQVGTQPVVSESLGEVPSTAQATPNVEATAPTEVKLDAQDPNETQAQDGSMENEHSAPEESQPQSVNLPADPAADAAPSKTETATNAPESDSSSKASIPVSGVSQPSDSIAPATEDASIAHTSDQAPVGAPGLLESTLDQNHKSEDRTTDQAALVAPQSTIDESQAAQGLASHPAHDPSSAPEPASASAHASASEVTTGAQEDKTSASAPAPTTTTNTDQAGNHHQQQPSAVPDPPLVPRLNVTAAPLTPYADATSNLGEHSAPSTTVDATSVVAASAPVTTANATSSADPTSSTGPIAPESTSKTLEPSTSSATAANAASPTSVKAANAEAPAGSGQEDVNTSSQPSGSEGIQVHTAGTASEASVEPSKQSSSAATATTSKAGTASSGSIAESASTVPAPETPTKKTSSSVDSPAPPTPSREGRVGLLLRINKELIRLCVELQTKELTADPLYREVAVRLQGNLGYLAGIADKSGKGAETGKSPASAQPTPPRLEPFPRSQHAPETPLIGLYDKLITLFQQAGFASPSGGGIDGRKRSRDGSMDSAMEEGRKRIATGASDESASAKRQPNGAESSAVGTPAASSTAAALESNSSAPSSDAAQPASMPVKAPNLALAPPVPIAPPQNTQNMPNNPQAQALVQAFGPNALVNLHALQSHIRGQGTHPWVSFMESTVPNFKSLPLQVQMQQMTSMQQAAVQRQKQQHAPGSQPGQMMVGGAGVSGDSPSSQQRPVSRQSNTNSPSAASPGMMAGSGRRSQTPNRTGTPGGQTTFPGTRPGSSGSVGSSTGRGRTSSAQISFDASGMQSSNSPASQQQSFGDASLQQASFSQPQVQPPGLATSAPGGGPGGMMPNLMNIPNLQSLPPHLQQQLRQQYFAQMQAQAQLQHVQQQGMRQQQQQPNLQGFGNMQPNQQQQGGGGAGGPTQPSQGWNFQAQ